MKERVLVAMSGGVDSSVAAYLLKDQGYEVVGITFQLYDYSRANRKAGKGGCCSLEDLEDAKWVCDKIGIPHYLMDSRVQFQKRVVDYFSETYKAGKTPNPCVACNTFIKFDELAFYAKSVNAPLFATGHYAKLVREGGNVYLETAKDRSKDQSYFLMGVARERLERCLFPLGDYTKEEVRNIADKVGLPVSHKPDSQEVCFIPENDYRKFLKESSNVHDAPGEIVTEQNEVLGNHRGIHYFTVGQRKGLGAYGLDAYYVIRVDAETNRVIVGRDPSLFSQGLTFEGDEKLWEGISQQNLTIKIRSRSAFIPGFLEKAEVPGQIPFRFIEPQRAVTPGQFAVVYQRNRVIGGGPIVKPVSKFNRSDAA